MSGPEEIERNDPEDFVRAAAGCLVSRNRLVEQNLPLARLLVKLVRRRYPRADRDELLQAGAIGLIKAIRGYNPARGKFSTYAGTAMRREMELHIQRDRLVTLGTATVLSPNTDTAQKRQAKTGFWSPVALADLLRAEPREQAEDWEHVSPAMVLTWMTQLSTRDQELLRLYYFEGQASGELSQRYRITRSAISKARLQALSRLAAIAAAAGYRR